jgi:hypothetical protein
VESGFMNRFYFSSMIARSQGPTVTVCP